MMHLVQGIVQQASPLVLVINSVHDFFAAVFALHTRAEGLLETTSLPSQGRGKAAYTLPSLDLTYGIILGMLLLLLYNGTSSTVKVLSALA